METGDGLKATCALRAQLDGFAAIHGARRVRSGGRTDGARALRAALARLIRIGDTTSGATGIDRFRQADVRLHRAIIALADVAGLAEAWEAVARELTTFSRMTLQRYWPDLHCLIAEHRFLVEAILDGDEFAAADAARSHLDAVWYRIEESQRDADDDRGRADPLQRALAYLAVNAMRPVRLERVAREVAGVSPGHLSRLFRERFGVPFSVYVQRRRLDHAAELLRNSRLSVARIAERVGYADPSRFAEHFRRAYDSTPLHYRNGAPRS